MEEQLIGFAKIKWEVGLIQFNLLGMNEEKTTIEANPATHAIAQYIEQNYIPKSEHELILYGIDEGVEQWKADVENCQYKFDKVYAALKELVDLKVIKETQGETLDYVSRKAEAWRAAKELVTVINNNQKV